MDMFNHPAGLFAQLAQGFGGAQMGRGHAGMYDEYLKAYSMAMLPKQRENLNGGGKIIMPPSALASLSALELESPWMFQLRNPSNPAASTHGGVLEFIAEEGVVHLPYWMMKTLRLSEGDAIRITSAHLPKGKLVKLQPQTVDFLEISDPKAVLEQCLRNYVALTQGDIIDILYNSITFSILIMDINPEGPGISVFETDLEVDFAAPKGYVEPLPKVAPPPPTMADKLKIDVNSSSPGSSRPASSLSGAFAGAGTGGGPSTISKGGDAWESFKGRGETLSGRKTKGKGVSARKVDELESGSRILRTDKRRIVSNDTLDVQQKIPSALNLPFGKLFFGFTYIPYRPPASEASDETYNANDSTSFRGSGNSLSSRTISGVPAPSPNRIHTPAVPGHTWGSGNSLGGSNRGLAPESTAASTKERSPTPDWGVDDDEVIYVDSD